MKPRTVRKPPRGASRKRVRRSLPWRQWVRKCMVLSVTLLGVGLLAGGGFAVDRLLSIPVAQVGFAGDLGYVDRKALIAAVEPHLQDGFFRLDLQALSDAVSQMPWVEQAQISRHWPRRLTITVVEQRPIARWGKKSLISHRGSVFTPSSVSEFANLPVLSGPDAQSALVMERYLALAEQLEFDGLHFSSLHLDARGNWSGELSNGMRLHFGTGDMMVKLQRFQTVYRTQLQGRVNEVAAVDMRYSNGLAVAWRHAKPRQS